MSDKEEDRNSDPALEVEAAGVPSDSLLPARMLSEYAYCPRLFYLMHVEGVWQENAFTLDGKLTHRRIERSDDALPDAEPSLGNSGGDPAPIISRSVTLGSERLGIIAKLDAVTTENENAVPVETKRGKVPNVPEKSYEPERVQLMAQALLLREHGYSCEKGFLYFAGSRTRVEICFTPELEARTIALIAEAKLAAALSVIPDPLEDSPKCVGCSLNGICLPDETNALKHVPVDPAAPHVRRLYPVRDDALPFYVQEQGASVGKRGKSLVVSKGDDELARVPLKDVSQLVLCGNVRVSTQTVQLLCEACVPIVYLSSGYWFYGVTQGQGLRNAYNRAAQFSTAGDEKRRMEFSRSIVHAKGMNQRTLLRRNAENISKDVLDAMNNLLENLDSVSEVATLLGFEGNLAKHYFENFTLMLNIGDLTESWDFNGRNRRPPRDPVNALLSFGYSMLTKECTVALLSEGLDPWWGLYHQPRHGRPALALDLMEEFRPILVDSAVISAINTRMITRSDFLLSKNGCLLRPAGRKALIRAYESRLDQMIEHPLFGYRCTWRAVIRLQARLLARWLRGDIPEYLGMKTR